MAYFSATPWLAPNEARIWFGDAVPSGSTVVREFMVGDFLWTTLAGVPLFYRCTTAPSSTNKDGLWQVAEAVQAVKSVSAAYAATVADNLIIQTNGAGVAVTLPAPASASGQSFTVKNKNGAVTNTVIAAGGAAIDGGTTATLGSAYASAVFRSDGTQYYVVSSFGTVTVA